MSTTVRDALQLARINRTRRRTERALHLAHCEGCRARTASAASGEHPLAAALRRALGEGVEMVSEPDQKPTAH